jgi:hypothetical protein
MGCVIVLIDKLGEVYGGRPSHVKELNAKIPERLG